MINSDWHYLPSYKKTPFYLLQSSAPNHKGHHLGQAVVQPFKPSTKNQSMARLNKRRGPNRNLLFTKGSSCVMKDNQRSLALASKTPTPSVVGSVVNIPHETVPVLNRSERLAQSRSHGDRVHCETLGPSACKICIRALTELQVNTFPGVYPQRAKPPWLRDAEPCPLCHEQYGRQGSVSAKSITFPSPSSARPNTVATTYSQTPTLYPMKDTIYPRAGPSYINRASSAGPDPIGWSREHCCSPHQLFMRVVKKSQTVSTAKPWQGNNRGDSLMSITQPETLTLDNWTGRVVSFAKDNVRPSKSDTGDEGTPETLDTGNSYGGEIGMRVTVTYTSS